MEKRSRSNTSLWHHPDFRRLWAAQTTSRFGTQISLLAIPLTAVLTLDASALEMGFITAASQAPLLLIGLPAGVWVDRLPRRPMLIAADLARFLLLLLIPLLAELDHLSITYLFLIVFCVGICSVFFDVADHSYLPTIVERERLTDANGKFATTASLAQLAGPGIAGGLVRILTAPLAILVDALSYLLSALFLMRIGTPEPSTTEGEADQNLAQSIRQGLAVVLGNPVLRSLAGATAINNLFLFVIRAVLILYATDDLGIGPGLLGLTFAVGSSGAIVAGLLAARLTDRLGLGRALIGGIGLASLSTLLIPVAGGPLPVAVLVLMVSQALGAFGGTLYNINSISLRQAITPDRLLGRMNATMRFIVWGVIPLGSILGGVLGETVGLRAALLVGACGSLLTVLWLLVSPLRSVGDLTYATATEPVP